MVVAIQKFIERFFFKKRNIYSIKKDSKINLIDLYPEFDFKKVKHEKELDKTILDIIEVSGIGKVYCDKVFERLNSKEFILFLIVNKQYSEIAGSYWAFIPKKNNSWFDSVRFKMGEALLCNAFVEIKYRRKGLYTGLIRESHKYLFEQVKSDIIYTIVEQSNKASNSVNRAFYGEPTFINHLFKLFSINIFSVIKNMSVFRLYFVPLGKKLYEK